MTIEFYVELSYNNFDISESELFVKQVNIEVLVAAMQKVKDSLKKRQEMELKQQLQAVQDPQMKLKLMQQYIQIKKVDATIPETEEDAE